MALDPRKMRDIVATANRLRIAATISADSDSDTTIEHVRRCFTRNETIKIRIPTPDREQFHAVAERLAEQVPCEIVQWLGRVVTLYRPGENSDD